MRMQKKIRATYCFLILFECFHIKHYITHKLQSLSKSQKIILYIGDELCIMCRRFNFPRLLKGHLLIVRKC